MAVHRPVAVTTFRRQTLDRGRLLRASVPAADAFALAAAVAIGGVSSWSVAFAAMVFLGLHLDPARSGRISPRLSTDAGWLLARASVPLVVLLPVASALGADPGWAVLGPVAVVLVFLGRGAAYAVSRRARAVQVLQPTSALNEPFASKNPSFLP